MRNELPKGWARTTLGEITAPSRERALPAEFPAMRYVGLEHIEPQTMRLVGYGNAREVRSSSVRFGKGDVLYGKMRPYLNKVWVAEFEGLCSAEFLVFAKQEGLNNEFLALRLNAEDFVAFANKQVSGERPRVTFELLARFPFLLPPTAEQQRIISKLDAAVSGLHRADIAARRAQDRLKRYRASVLQAAVTGELTRAWREEHWKSEMDKTEGGNTLLQHLLTMRHARWEKAELTRLRSTGKARPRDDAWKFRYREPILPARDSSVQVPRGWAWASIDQLAWDSGYGTSVKCTEDGKGPAVLRIPNVRDGALDFNNLKFAANSQEITTDQFVGPGDLLLIRTNGSKDLIGRTAIVKTQPKQECAFASYLIRFRLVKSAELWSWLALAWDSTLIRAQIEAKAKTTAGQYNVSLSGLNDTAIPLPPLAELSESVREAERRLAAADRLASALDSQLERARATRESLLREAFIGRLVRQDPNDEPASILLEHIHAEKARTDAVRQERRLGAQPTRREERHSMKDQPPSAESLIAAWEKIGRKADARRLFDEAGFNPDNVVQFYEVLRATPQLRTAFQKSAQGRRQKQKPATQSKNESQQPSGRFRLVELWLEDFKNLKDYKVTSFPSVE